MLTNNEMINIDGGRINWGLVSIISGAVALVVGIIDGFFRPLKCNK